MKRAKKSERGPAGPDAGVWASPEFKILSGGLQKILNVPKSRVEAILAEEKSARKDNEGDAAK